MDIPSPTHDLDQARADLDHAGVAIVSDVLSPAQTERARHQLIRIAEEERRDGRAILEDGSAADGRYRPGPNQRVAALLEKDEVFGELACHEAPLHITRRLFADAYGYPEEVVEQFGLAELRLSSATANIANRGGVPMTLHSDQGFTPDTDYPVLVNAAWPLVDIDHSNGATEVVPGSHRIDVATMASRPPVPTPVSAPAGSVILLDGRTWHRTGANTTDLPRPVVLINYCRPWVRPFDDRIVTYSRRLLAAKPWFVYDLPAV